MAPLRWVDTHVHLNDTRYAEDLDAVMARAHEAGVVRMICCAWNERSLDDALALAQRYDSIWVAAGLHPSDAADWEPGFAGRLDALLAAADANRIVAVGEIGMDFYYEQGEAIARVQEEALRGQLALAARYDLPVIVHNREAHDAIATVFEQLEGEGGLSARRGVFHCFSGSRDFYLQRILPLGFDAGFDGPVTYRNARRSHEVIEAIPLERLPRDGLPLAAAGPASRQAQRAGLPAADRSAGRRAARHRLRGPCGSALAQRPAPLLAGRRLRARNFAEKLKKGC